jgi:hypothetical protein
MALKNRLQRLESNDAFAVESETSAQVREYQDVVMAYCDRCTLASKEFVLLHDQEPVEGDMLRYEEIQGTTGVDWLDWGTYIDTCEGIDPVAEGQEVERDGYCLKVEGGRIFRTLASDQQRQFKRGISMTLWSPVVDSEWWLFKLCEPKSRWRQVEEEALGVDPGRHHPTKPIPTFAAVTFLGVIRGRHRCRPATDAEVEAKHASRTRSSV